jgi:predicted DsbA family dithiol-disulfide isomerase
VRADYDVEVRWQAFELHPGVPPEGMPIPWPPERRAAGRDQFRRLADAAGLPYGERTHWYDTLPAHEAAEWVGARDPGDGAAADAFRRAVFEAYFVHDRNIGDGEVLAGIAGALGLDAADLRAALAQHRHRDAVEAQLADARESGVDAVPTFAAGRYAVVGAQPYDVLRRLMGAAGYLPKAAPQEEAAQE